MPDAAGLFSTMTRWPSASPSLSAMKRAVASVVAELAAKEAARDVVRPAGAEADDQPDRPRRIGLLRVCGANEREQCERAAKAGLRQRHCTGHLNSQLVTRDASL